MSPRDRDVKDLIAAQAAEYYVARRAGDVTASDDQEFLEWLRASPTHVAEYLAVAGLAKEMRGATSRIDASLDTLTDDARRETNLVSLDDAHYRYTPEEPSLPSTVNLRGYLTRIRGRAWFAAVVVALVVGICVWLSTAQEFATALGEQRTLQLPDNTIVHINSDSAVKIRFDSHRRIVELERGQVYFEVAKDSQRPFQVRAGGSVIEDRGTVFDVFRDDNNTVVTVVEGEVTIQKPIKLDLPGRRGVQPPDQLVLSELHPGDQATVLSSGAVNMKSAVNLNQVTAWTRGEILFDTEQVGAVAKEFNRYNRRKIVVVDPSVAALPISGLFHTHDIDSFAQFLDGLPGVRTVANGEKLIVSGRPVVKYD